MYDSFNHALASKAEQRKWLHDHNAAIVFATLMAWFFLSNTLVAACRLRGKGTNVIYILYLLQSLLGAGLPTGVFYSYALDCATAIYAAIILFYLSDLCAMLIIFYKAYLVSGRRPWLLVVTAGLELATLATIVWAALTNGATRSNDICQQQIYNAAPFAIRGLLSIAKNSLLCGCLFIPVHTRRKSFKQSPLSRLVIRDGVIYLVIIAWVTIVCSTFSAIYSANSPRASGMVFTVEVFVHSMLLRVQFAPHHISSLEL
ncbi:hypothetical protein SYNPS1DRAFT_31593 [Syncephalis pseudoplumigaleata]|uniref:Uncharacterized protein n=1 Tax=Syncephalis pseudoplumigaleata TaxID=1712513 RepID=A0A4P9YV39_9FUNG|nr:hypothetical protein SYNPS1DRAFT_31593 [Syncephalis pseudoplumigaleata]|eukprot:RKP22770.1 hypothetical protein SYNPS1DRAFT_31593 [Syncephalis pseudoplumigaleata]